jgi:hypothetical protein
MISGDGQGVCADPALIAGSMNTVSDESHFVQAPNEKSSEQGWGKEDVHISNLHNVVSKNGETIVITDNRHDIRRAPQVNQIVPSDRDRYDIF